MRKLEALVSTIQRLLTVNSPVTASNPTWMVCSKSEGREISGRSFSFFLLARGKTLTHTYFLHSFSFKNSHNQVCSNEYLRSGKQLNYRPSYLANRSKLIQYQPNCQLPNCSGRSRRSQSILVFFQSAPPLPKLSAHEEAFLGCL